MKLISTIPKRRKVAKAQRAKLIVKGIRLTWKSLDSHLDWVSTKEGNFEKDCIAMYAEVINIFGQLF